MLAAHEVQEAPKLKMLTGREWSAATGVPPGLDRLLWLKPSGGIVEIVMEDLDG